jgi:hypothetical protein
VLKASSALWQAAKKATRRVSGRKKGTSRRNTAALDRANYKLNKRTFVIGLIAGFIALLTLIATVAPREGHHMLRLIMRRLERAPLPRADPAAFTVGVAYLNNDDDNVGQTALLAALLPLNSEKVRIIRFDREIPSNSAEEGESAARVLLKDSGTNLLIWGTWMHVDGKDLVQLHMTAPGPMILLNNSNLYPLSPATLVEAPFWGDLMGVIELDIADLAINSKAPDSCSETSEQLREMITRVERLAQSRASAEWPPHDRVELNLELGDALQTLYLLTGDPEVARESLQLDNDVARQLSTDDPNDQAQVEIALALADLDEMLWNGSDKREAAERAAKDAFNKASKPDTRAQAELVLGLTSLSTDIGPPEKLKADDESLAHFQNALSYFRRDSQSDLSALEGLLALAHSAHGFRKHDAAEIFQSVGDEQNLLKGLDPANSPYDWATLQWLVGTGFYLLGLVQRNPDSFRQALYRFSDAQRILTLECRPLDWAEIEMTVAGSNEWLGEWDQSTVELKTAEESYHQALKVFSNVNFPATWSAAQLGLAVNLQQRADIEKDYRPLCQSWYRALKCSSVVKSCPSAAVAIGDYEDLRRNFGSDSLEKCSQKLSDAGLSLNLPSFEVHDIQTFPISKMKDHLLKQLDDPNTSPADERKIRKLLETMPNEKSKRAEMRN